MVRGWGSLTGPQDVLGSSTCRPRLPMWASQMDRQTSCMPAELRPGRVREPRLPSDNLLLIAKKEHPKGPPLILCPAKDSIQAKGDSCLPPKITASLLTVSSLQTAGTLHRARGESLTAQNWRLGESLLTALQTHGETAGRMWSLSWSPVCPLVPEDHSYVTGSA